jgi:hypothetical protein
VFLNHLLQSAQQHRKFVRRRIGARYVQGDVTIIGDPGTQDTEDADRIIGATLEITISSLPTIQERSYIRPVPVGKIQYPRRAGKPLDHLLYSMVREAAKPGNSKIVRDVDPSQSMKPRR